MEPIPPEQNTQHWQLEILITDCLGFVVIVCGEHCVNVLVTMLGCQTVEMSMSTDPVFRRDISYV